ncbi:MAG: cytochrome C oxidase Cbb3 [Desulfuromonas sp.]|nr:MAG: cytochrome C oxidase Cbb3 [Desulfuromonas sp.]
MNWKKILLLVLILIFTASTAMAIRGGNSRRGKHYYKKECLICHDDGGDGGEILPGDKTMRQWDRYFKRGAANHPGDVFKDLSKKKIKDINQFLYDHAKDSPAPATCG